MSRNSNARFTASELLIVGVILGTLAAVVVPQLTRANVDVKIDALDETVESVRSAIAKYRVQHRGALPGERAGVLNSALFWGQLVGKTDQGGTIYKSAGVNVKLVGPYLSVIPQNLLLKGKAGQLPTVCDGLTDPPTNCAGADFYFNVADGSGKFWAVVNSAGAAEE